MPSARIIGTGSYAPAKVLTNAELEKLVNTSDEWIRTRTGISERRMTTEAEATSDLAYQAALRALAAAGLDPADLDMILVATVTPDMFFPSTACVLQDRLGARRAGAMDISAACSGFVYGLAVADGLLRLGTLRNILLVGAETLTKIVNWRDRNTCVLFGDGAGAVVLRACEGERGILSTHLFADGAKGSQLMIPGGGSRHPITQRLVDEGLAAIQMSNGNEVFKVAVRAMEDAALTALKHNHLDVGDVDLLVPHQANLRIINAVGQRLGFAEDRVCVNIQKYGNTSAASIPLALDEAVQAGRVHEGDLLLLVAFGGGLTWASAVIRW
ncbi:MAG: ketoacyl-ACP synthase III [candidate division NC10 bacterium]|nr:ketoacyl-ACP synthase III [candidate division NC10 bacterium]MBI4841563.1 ketoacyl-ACP synthase III [candidate division NC10 bacterium]